MKTLSEQKPEQQSEQKNNKAYQSNAIDVAKSNMGIHERKQLNEKHLATGIKIKYAYHQERYNNPAVPEPLVLDKGVKQELEVVKPAPAETYSPSLRPRF